MYDRLALAFALAAVALGASGCERWIDGIARHTGVGFDSEGVVHAFLWAHNEGRDTSSFWHEPWRDQPRAPDPLVDKPIAWRSVPRSSPAAESRIPATSWRRFVVTSRDTDGRQSERTWDFCLTPVYDRGPRYRLLEIWPGALDTFARCSAALESERYRKPHPDEPARDPTIAARIRQRAKVLLGRDLAPTVACAMACGPTGTNRDCDLCICLQLKLSTADCDEAAAQYRLRAPKVP